MNIYDQWTQTVIEFVKTRGEQAFWREYGEIEKKFYSQLLAKPDEAVKGVVKELAVQFDIAEIYFVGVLDGVNESLVEPLDLDNLTLDTEIEIKPDLEKLYINMLDAKADYLYSLPQWDAIYSEEKRKELEKQYKQSKIVVKEKKIGRNEPCPCGSGKKYKKCCAK